VHWLTDLAAAVPTPLHGCEKFVVQFPLAVLSSFIRSFHLVGRLAHSPPTTLFEEFLQEWWPEKALGPLPSGDEAIALMRLVVQVQNLDDQKLVYAAWRLLDDEARGILSAEMAYTGVEGQTYALTGPVREQGPAFLVYYSPAFLRTCVGDHPKEALAVLSEIYRGGRSLFPLCDAASAECVTLYIDRLKAISVPQIVKLYENGRCWLLVKQNEKEAVVQEHALADLCAVIRDTQTACCVLNLWPSAIWPELPPGDAAPAQLGDSQ